MAPLGPAQQRFVAQAIRRKPLFLRLTWVGLVVAGGLAVYYGVLGLRGTEGPWGARTVIVLLVLLNARQNLRQFKYAEVLERLVQPTRP